MKTISVRFNVGAGASPLIWRALIDGKEELVTHIISEAKSKTTTDPMEDGAIKHHVTYEAKHHYFVEPHGTNQRILYIS